MPLLFILLFLGTIAYLSVNGLSIMLSFSDSPGGKVSQTDTCHVPDIVSCSMVNANGMQRNDNAAGLVLHITQRQG